MRKRVGGPLWIMMGTLAVGALGPTQRATAQPSDDPVTSVCELKATRREGPVSVMTGAYYDFEHGYFLSTPECQDTVDGTGVLAVKFPPDKSLDDFPELAKLSSQEWLGANVGRRVRFQGEGRMSFSGGYPEFTMSAADKVWASSD
jgi:hypothetical protein